MDIYCSDIVAFMEKLAPPYLAEDWDNSGLILGNSKQRVRSIMTCLSVTSKVVEEAVDRKVDILISHHPLIFRGITAINEKDGKGRLIYRLIRNGISVYCAHTNLDAAEEGVNDSLAKALGLKEIRNLKRHMVERLYKVVVFVPEENTDMVRDAMCRAGAGWIGNYSHCTFASIGTGTFKPLAGTKPYIGRQGELEKVAECRLETVVPDSRLKSVLDAMLEVHPYEEVAYDVYSLELNAKEYGMGKVGFLKPPQRFETFINFLKTSLGVSHVRIVGDVKHDIEKVAVFCGSFDDKIIGLLERDTDILVTGDLRYHTAVDMVEAGFCVVDAGHFNTEHLIVRKLMEILSERFPDIDVVSSVAEEDPFRYY